MAALQLTPAEEGELRARIRREAESLAREFAGIFSPETVERYVTESFDAIRGRARLLDFVPVFVHRYSRERLRALAQAEGLIAKDRPEVLYVCVHNAGRSQIAAALTARLSGGAVAVRSAGSDAADEINPATPAPSIPASGTWTGTCPTRPGSPARSSRRSSRISSSGCGSSSRSWASPPCSNVRPGSTTPCRCRPGPRRTPRASSGR